MALGITRLFLAIYVFHLVRDSSGVTTLREQNLPHEGLKYVLEGLKVWGEKEKENMGRSRVKQYMVAAIMSQKEINVSSLRCAVDPS